MAARTSVVAAPAARWHGAVGGDGGAGGGSSDGLKFAGSESASLVTTPPARWQSGGWRWEVSITAAR